jgi:putative ABC transport system substrate-binding protein
MISRREMLVAFGASALAFAAPCVAQRQSEFRRIGFLGPSTAKGSLSRIDALRAGLRDFGYVEGKNLAIEFRWAEEKYERLPELAAELVRMKVDVLVTHSIPGTLAAKRATTTIPIVMAVAGDAVATGLVPSLARPEGNVTGSTFFQPELMAKRLELIKETLPRTAHAAALLNPDNSGARPAFQAMETAAKSLKMDLQRYDVRGPGEFDAAFSAMARKHVETVVVEEDPMLIANVSGIASIAAKKRISSIGFTEFAEAGGLIGYTADLLQLWRRAAYFVDKIFKGAKPADIPVEQPTKFELVINMKTAKALGIKMPQSIMLRADRMIE